MTLQSPYWLLMLLIIPLLGLSWILIPRMRRSRWHSFTSPRLSHHLLKTGNLFTRRISAILLLIALIFMIAGLARPQIKQGLGEETSTGKNVLFALDLSRSMRVNDVKPDRLSKAKVLLYELMDSMPNERVGLIGFGGDAYSYAPLTIDHAAVREVIEQIDEQWMPQGGTNLANAVELGIETLKKTGQKTNALVILSDGEKHEGEMNSIINAAAHAGIYIVTIGIGTEDGGFVPDPNSAGLPMLSANGKEVISRLMPQFLIQLATETNGRYIAANRTINIPEVVQSIVQDLDNYQIKGRSKEIATEFFQWLVLPAIIVLFASIIFATRWRGIGATALLLVTLHSSPTASANQAAEALKLLDSKNYSGSLEMYRRLANDSMLPERRATFRLGEGLSAYRAEQFKDARNAFSRALTAKSSETRAAAHLGVANTLFQMGWIILTEKSYPQASDELPDSNRFDTIVRERLSTLRMSELSADGNPQGLGVLRGLVTDWADAVRHYDSSLAIGRDKEEASSNRELTMRYLLRLKELLEEEQETMQQAMQQAMPGQGPPREGDGGGEGDEENPGKGKSNKEKQGDGDGDQREDKRGGDRSKKEDPEPNDSKKGQSTGETPEERAGRILKENSDLEKGPLTSGKGELSGPEKDW